jgi:hypothetical protein
MFYESIVSLSNYAPPFSSFIHFGERGCRRIVCLTLDSAR